MEQATTSKYDSSVFIKGGIPNELRILHATACANRTARLWNTQGTLLNTYKGHLDRLARVAFHPPGKFFWYN
jgi:WD40 repeat protein